MFDRLDSRPDVLSQVLATVRLGSAQAARTEVAAPWALRFHKSNDRRAGFHVVVQGQCWIRLEGAAQDVPLAAGDVLVLPHGTSHTLSDPPGAEGVDIFPFVEGLRPGERAMLPSGAGARAVLLCGSYSFAADGANPLLRGLPELIHLPGARIRDDAAGAVLKLLAAEACTAAEPGSAMAVERLVDLLFVYALRAWMRLDGGAPMAWLGALHDPVVGPALRAVHEDPGRNWSVDTLAALAGLSRAPFARRFSARVGEPPLAYVARWRMALAADLLERGHSVAQAAGQVGYGDEFAFAKAFKRLRGVAPGQHRQRHPR